MDGDRNNSRPSGAWSMVYGVSLGLMQLLPVWWLTDSFPLALSVAALVALAAGLFFERLRHRS